MRRSLVLPGWARQHFALVVGLIVLSAIFLRVTPRDAAMVDPARSHHYLPVAAAIGLTQDVPHDAALVTWVNAGLYAVRYHIQRVIAPGTSTVDYCAGFLSDPEGFCALAEFASLVAGIFTILLAYSLVAKVVDPVAGVAAAFLIAVHPVAVAFTSGINSGAFCLLFLLCGLSIAAKIDWSEARAVDLAAIGLSFGFALDAIPLAAPLFLAVIILGLRATPTEQRLRRTGQTALGIACFIIAGAAVIPEARPPAEALQIIGLSAAIVAALMFAAHALRSARLLVGDSVYSSALLFLVLAVGVLAVTSFSPQRPATDETPGLLASDWLISHAPGGSAIAVDPRLASAVSLPRNSRSWWREYQASPDAPDSSRLYALAASRAAAQVPGPRFDVFFAPDDVPTTCAALPGVPAETHYLVLPEGVDPAPLACDRPWLVARFRSERDGQPGVTIWGTQSSPGVEPVHVEWRMTSQYKMAALPTQ